jgi:hemerythrin-like metal-binding protein
MTAAARSLQHGAGSSMRASLPMFSSEANVFRWNDSYSVGIPDIDIQHQQLFAIIDELQQAMKGGQSKSVMGKTLARLLDYTVRHFSFEQAMLARKGYSDTTAHKATHDRFVDQIKQYQRNHEDGTLGVSTQLMDTLQKWLAEHIKGTDMKYAKELGTRA